MCFGASPQAHPVFCALGQKVITSSGAACSFALTLEWAAPCVCIPRAGSPWRPRAGAEGSRKSGDRLVGDSRCLGTQRAEGSLGARCPSGDGARSSGRALRALYQVMGLEGGRSASGSQSGLGPSLPASGLFCAHGRGKNNADGTCEVPGAKRGPGPHFPTRVSSPPQVHRGTVPLVKHQLPGGGSHGAGLAGMLWDRKGLLVSRSRHAAGAEQGWRGDPSWAAAFLLLPGSPQPRCLVHRSPFPEGGSSGPCSRDSPSAGATACGPFRPPEIASAARSQRSPHHPMHPLQCPAHVWT